MESWSCFVLFFQKLNVTISVFDTTLFLNGGKASLGFLYINIVRMHFLSLSLSLNRKRKSRLHTDGGLFLYVLINGCFLPVFFPFTRVGEGQNGSRNGI